MKRLLTCCLTLMLALSLCVPASAVDLAGPLGESAKPHIIDTGRGYVLYYEAGTSMYFSTDKQEWTALPDRAWIQEGAYYNPLLRSPLITKSYQIVWTGTEYMMCQDLRDSARETDRTVGDSPRNKMVTFLDTDWNILGVKAFDAPVTAIRAQDGVYYATVDGAEHSFSRSEWDSGPFVDENGAPLGTFYTGWFHHKWDNDEYYLIRERSGDDSPFALSISWDGRSWVPLETYMTSDLMRLTETGGAVVYYCAYTGEAYYYQISGSRYTSYTGGWAKADFGFDPVEGLASPSVEYTFRWTGDGYIMCQSAGERGGMMGSGPQGGSPRNTYVTFLDQEFHRTGEHDFGAPVTGVAWREGISYAEAAAPESAPVIYQSQDGETWSVSPLTALPKPEPVSSDAFPDWPGREYVLSPRTPRACRSQEKPRKEMPAWSISRPNGF